MGKSLSEELLFLEKLPLSCRVSCREAKAKEEAKWREKTDVEEGVRLPPGLQYPMLGKCMGKQNTN